MFKWEKLGLVFSPQEHDTPVWMNEFAQAPSVLVFDDFIRVYFACRPPRDENGQYISHSAYIDLDRKDIFKIISIGQDPILPLGKLGTFDEFGTYPASIIKHKSEYLAYYGGWTRCESVPFNVGIGMARSSNGGKTFQKEGDGPIISYSPNEPFILSGPKIRRFNEQFQLFYIAGSKWVMDEGKPEPVYRVRMATSDDGVNWQKLNKDLINVRLEEDECQASPDVFYYEGKYHMFFCYRYSKGYRSHEKGYRIGYAYSSDLVNWIRDDSKAGIDVSTEGWDSEMVSYPHIFELDGEVYMFYLGNQVGRHGFGAVRLLEYSVQ